MKESQGVRLTRSERQYFKEYWDENFSSWVHNKIKEDLQKIQGNIWKNRFQNFAYSMVMMGIGAMFWLFLLSMDNLASIIIVGLIGLFLVSSGAVTFMLEWKKDGRIPRR